jgi:starvation-inducible DNA-binding protein
VEPGWHISVEARRPRWRIVAAPAPPLKADFLRQEAIVSKNKNSSKVSPDLDTPSDLPQEAVDKISKTLNVLLADTFALYLKTKNFHWHVSGRHFRDYHLLLDQQADDIFATTDELAERVRKVGGTTLRSIGHIAKLQTLKDNDEAYVPPREMLRELMNDNKKVAAAMRKAHKVVDDLEDAATAGLLENFIDQTERRTWFLFEASREEGGNER